MKQILEVYEISLASGHFEDMYFYDVYFRTSRAGWNNKIHRTVVVAKDELDVIKRLRQQYVVELKERESS